VLGSLLAGVVSLGVAAIVLVQMPDDYFVRDEHQRSPHWLLRNVLGWRSSLPAGDERARDSRQGLLTLLAGLILADFPAS